MWTFCLSVLRLFCKGQEIKAKVRHRLENVYEEKHAIKRTNALFIKKIFASYTSNNEFIHKNFKRKELMNKPDKQQREL